MLDRRGFLRGAAALGLGGAAAGGLAATGATRRGSRTLAATDTAATGPQTALPLTVVNHTYRYANDQIWLYVVGTDLATGRQVHARADGSLVPVALSDNGPDGFADLSVPLVPDGDTALAVPAGMSGRIYVSTGEKLKFRVVVDGAGNAALQYPAGWVVSDPSYGVVHDFVEFTHNDGGMFCNTTAVDMFGVPLAIRLRGAADQTTGQLVPGGRDAIFAAIAAEPAFAPLVVDGVRVIAPGHGIDAGIFPADYFDGAVDAVWNRYGSQSLTVATGSATRTGRVDGDVLRFDGGVAPIGRPTTQDIFYCAGALAAPNDGVTGPVAAVVGAAFNRSTLLDQPAQPASDPATFYRDPVTNHYSAAIHANTVDGKAYGFPFDDVTGQASYIQDTAPTGMTLSLTPF